MIDIRRRLPLPAAVCLPGCPLPRPGPIRVGLLAAAIVLATVLTGCEVNTRVAVTESAGGRGVVAVTVTLDRGALAAIGGLAALAAQLQDADLVAAGWAVSGPKPGPGSTTVISASHPFTTLAQAGVLVGDLAGSGSGESRPFRVTLSSHHSFWRTDTTLAGTVDLTCGLDCFGDSGLRRALGSAVGVNPAPLESSAGQRPDQVFTFAISARLAGSLVTTNASSRPDGSLEWTPRLGQTLELAAVTRAWNRSHITALAIGGGVLVVVVIGLFWVVIHRWRRRRRRRRVMPAGAGARAGGPGTQGQAVTPHP